MYNVTLWRDRLTFLPPEMYYETDTNSLEEKAFIDDLLSPATIELT
jgi:hypothetical protein